ncbi:MAG: L-seryl-tRNA(Sec) selenium transferase [Deltaproteobacteria bacterium]|nr:L-seryl-tRNA(Sec) selenium transferase [Deltaproteobacteria bacterium]
MDSTRQDELRQLPAVDLLLRQLAAGEGRDLPRWALLRAVREALAERRAALLAGEPSAAELDLGVVAGRARSLLRPSLARVINATGVVLHTNLGRAPLAEAALDRLAEVARGYCNVEYVLGERRRGSRHAHARELLRELCGAEEALVVNNNAAAVVLCLASLAAGREVVVSRGELIEIGGSFRLPEVMAASGARLREVGTTNRTHPADYEGAIGEETGLLLKVHRSNFALTGFTAEVSSEELVALGRARGVPTMFDLGSGTLTDLGALGLPGEPTVDRVVAAGFDVVTLSGDKLLGGPQAGLIVGRAEPLARIRSHPLMRAVRPGKLTLAALEATLALYRDGTAVERVPALGRLSTSLAELERYARTVSGRLREALGAAWRVEVLHVAAPTGGGALPGASLPSVAVGLAHPERSVDALQAALQRGEPPVVARIEGERLLLDLRAVAESELEELARAVAGTFAERA